MDEVVDEDEAEEVQAVPLANWYVPMVLDHVSAEHIVNHHSLDKAVAVRLEHPHLAEVL